MNKTKFIFLTVVTVLILQLVLTRYCQIGPFIYISLLPALILCMPTSLNTTTTLVIAFVCGAAVDFLADGVPGLNAAAIVPVAALQKSSIRLFINSNIVDRGYSFSFHQDGIVKISLALAMETVIFQLIYVIIDCAGSRNFGFILLKVLVSSCISVIFGLILCNVLCPRRRQ